MQTAWRRWTRLLERPMNRQRRHHARETICRFGVPHSSAGRSVRHRRRADGRHGPGASRHAWPVRSPRPMSARRSPARRCSSPERRPARSPASDGTYRIPLRPGKYELRVRYIGWTGVHDSVTVAAGPDDDEGLRARRDRRRRSRRWRSSARRGEARTVTESPVPIDVLTSAGHRLHRSHRDEPDPPDARAVVQLSAAVDRRRLRSR